MARWLSCYLCGCTGVHRDPVTLAEFRCPNGCEGGRVYEAKNPAWFERLVACGAEVFSDETALPKNRQAAATL